MKLHHTGITDLGADNARVTLVLFDGEHLDDARESISLTVEMEIAGTPYLKEVQREALEKARHTLDLKIQATKSMPRPAS